MLDVDLKTISYHETQPLNWSVEGLIFGQINLLVGKNATGKTRVLNLIGGLARQLQTDRLTVANAGYDVVFSVDGTDLRYKWRAENKKVLEECVWLGGEEKLRRDAKILTLRYEKENTKISHEPSEDEISASARKDKLQHPFLLPLAEWGESVRAYHFGSKLGQDQIPLIVNKAPEIDDRDENLAVGIFLRGKKEFGGEYVSSLLADMNDLGYPLSEIDAVQPEHVTVALSLPVTPSFQIPGQIKALGVCERGVEGMFFQDTMSQGMFRALSVLVQVTYSQISQRAHCILIDDIGEGLDFERSARLIDILRRKAQQSKFQLIMSTNDQFVMNHVPLDEWSVLQRRGSLVTVKNIYNARKAFEDFKFVGMSNFSFFEMDFPSENEPDDRQLVFEGAGDDA